MKRLLKPLSVQDRQQLSISKDLSLRRSLFVIDAATAWVTWPLVCTICTPNYISYISRLLDLHVVGPDRRIHV